MINTVTIKKNFEFLRVYKRGRFYVGKIMTMYVLANKHDINRIGITASKKYGKSVKRNRIRRLIKESYRSVEEILKPGYDIVFVARSNEIVPDYLSVKKEMKFLFKKLGILDKIK